MWPLILGLFLPSWEGSYFCLFACPPGGCRGRLWARQPGPESQDPSTLGVTAGGAPVQTKEDLWSDGASFCSCLYTYL